MNLSFLAQPIWREAQDCLMRGDLGGARRRLVTLRAHGDGAHAGLLAAQIAWGEDRIRDGVRLALDAAPLAPGDADALLLVASTLLAMGESAKAREYLGRCQLEGCTNPLLLIELAALHKRLELHADALSILDRAKALLPSDPALMYMRGEELAYNGRLAESEAALRESFSAAPGRGRVALSLVRLRPQTAEHNYLPAIERGTRVTVPGSDDAAALEFARYKTLEDLGRFDEAWQVLARGNALMRARLPPVSAGGNAWLDPFVAASPPAGGPWKIVQPAGPTPIFIVGMPRSGTTLLERMLGNHSRVAVAGELLDFQQQLSWVADARNTQAASLIARLSGLDYGELGRRYLTQTRWRAHGKEYFVDKQPPNWVFAGMIRTALPRARILHLVRDPMDVCFSNWRAWFGDACAYSYDMDALPIQYREYERTMAHWHKVMPGAILDVSYVALVAEPEATLRRVFEFCGLKWEAGCADPGRNATPSATLSAAQVRGTVRTDTSRWRHYAAQLEPLRVALGPAVD